MSSGDRWFVIVYNDDANTFTVLHHLLRKVCGLADAQAREKTLEVHRSGRALVGSHDRETAEAITVKLMRCGLRAKFGSARW